MNRNLSTADVARILGMREARVRELARAGLCRSARRGHRYAFTFQDLVVLRAAQGLLQSGVSGARARRSLAVLRRALPPERPLSGLRIYADGREVVVRDGDSAWHPETGQIVLNFAVDELSRRADEVRAGTDERGEPDDALGRAQREFERGLALEDEQPEAARTAYRRALQLNPELVDAYVNLGRIEHEAGRPEEATRLYHRALARSAEDPVIHYNLALALEDTKGAAVAAEHYERALALDPDFADAHYNLAGLCEALGHEADALRHYRAYQNLTEE